MTARVYQSEALRNRSMPNRPNRKLPPIAAMADERLHLVPNRAEHGQLWERIAEGQS